MTTIATKPQGERQAADDDDAAAIERLLGLNPYFFLDEFAKLTKRSRPSLYRDMREKKLPFVWVGDRRAFTRAVAKRILLHGTRRDV